MILDRNLTSVVNWCLDHLCPPFLRDCRWFMHTIIWFAYGKYTPLVLDFKDKLPALSDRDLSTYYEAIQAAPINQRPTDLNRQSLAFVLEHLTGDSFLDAACGRGFLCKKIREKTGGAVTGIDIVPPPVQSSGIHFVKGQLKAMPFKEKSFDTVVCTHALEHVREPKLCIEELLRVCRERLIIIVPRQREYRYTPDLHINFFPYLYDFQNLVNVPGAKYFLLGNDFGCVIDLKEST